MLILCLSFISRWIYVLYQLRDERYFLDEAVYSTLEEEEMLNQIVFAA